MIIIMNNHKLNYNIKDIFKKNRNYKKLLNNVKN